MNTKNKKQKLGRYKNLAYSLILVTIMITGLIAPVSAVELNAQISTTSTTTKPSFQFVRSYVIGYPDGGEMKNLLKGQNVSMTFHVDPSDPIEKDLVMNLTAEIIGNLKSAASITDADITYEAQFYGGETEAHVDYKITLVPTVTNYVLRPATSDSAAILDTQWRGLIIQNPIVVNIQNYGQFDINSPLSFIQKQFPQLYSKLQGSDAENLFEVPLMSSNNIMDDPISKWQHLFDPAYTLVETNGLGYKGQKITFSTYATGESNLSEGLMLPTVENADLKLDVDYPVSYTERSSTASIDMDGYVAVADIDGIEYFGSSPQAPHGSGISSTGDYSSQVIYFMTAFAVVLAIGIFWWSNRMVKVAMKRGVDTSPPPTFQYEDRKHWADRFDDDNK